MSKVSKLVIKACSDNKFSSFTGEFITSINPEHLVIKSAVSYHVTQGMPSASLLRYRGSPPKLLSFSLLFDNTGIMPGSDTNTAMEQVKKLQEVAYRIHTKNNAPNYIRVIWGQIDFKGRLVDLDIVYSMFQVDGTVVRAEAHMSVLEEFVPLGKGQAAAGVDSNHAKPSGATATSNRKVPSSQTTPSQEGFAPTPNGMNGAYSGAPPGAYDGGPDAVYHGSNGAGGSVYGSSVAAGPSGSSVSSVETTRSSGYDAGVDSGRSAGYSASPSPDVDQAGSGLKGGVAGNGPGGSGGGIGGGGHGPVSGAGQSGGAAPPSGMGSPTSRPGASGGSHRAGSGPAGAAKSKVAPGPGSGAAVEKGGRFKAGSIAAAGVAGSSIAAAAAAGGADSLRKLKSVDLKGMGINFVKNKLSWKERLKMFVKKVAPRAYNAGKKLVK